MSVDTGVWQGGVRWGETAVEGAPPPLLQLLGPITAIGTRSGLQLTYRKGWALLGYLLVEHGRSHPRGELAALLWPSLAETAALTNLRQVLCDLRHKLEPLLGKGQLLIDREWVCLRLDPARRISDLEQIEALTSGAQTNHEPAAYAWLLECGELLEGWGGDAVGEFAFWLSTTRQWYQQQWRRALDRVRGAAQQAGDWRLALECVRCQIRADPWDEVLHRQRMMLYSAMGQAQLALASYSELECVLQRELGLLPQRETVELAGLIRSDVPVGCAGGSAIQAKKTRRMGANGAAV